MKFALLGLALTATATHAQYNDQGNGRPSYGKEPVYGLESSYGERPGYGGQRQPTGYGKPPAKQPGYGKPPAQIGDQTKRHFDQFYDNLQFCNAETSLAQCIISSQSREDCVSEDRVNICTSQFVSKLCSSIQSTTTGTYDNGYFKATSNTCVDAALADSILVYNKLLRESDNAFVATPQIDTWSFATIKLALSTTRTHADCVIKSFFNYLNGCAKARALRSKDLECVNKVLSSGRCDAAYETGDGWTIKDFIGEYKTLIGQLDEKIDINDVLPSSPSKDLIDKLLADLEGFRAVEYVEGSYNFETRTNSVNLKRYETPPTSIHAEDGTAVEDLVFHLPLENEVKTIWKKPTTTKPAGGIGPAVAGKEQKPIGELCGEFFLKSKGKWDSAIKDKWFILTTEETPPRNIPVTLNDENNIECISDGSQPAKCKIPTNDEDKKNPQGNKIECIRAAAQKGESKDCPLLREAIKEYLISDKCYSYSGYSITFLDNGSTVPLDIKAVVGQVGDNPNAIASYTATWSEPHTCTSHLTQWKQSVSCCKSYATVLREVQSSWDKQNKNSYSQSKKPERPTEVPAKYNTNKNIYEKVFTSAKDSGEVKPLNAAQTGPRLDALPKALKEYIRKYIALFKKSKSSTMALLADDYKPQTPSCYLSSSPTYSRLCTSLQRSWEPNTVIPVANTKCFPQACVLSQLSKCADIPEKKAGYDYIAQPQPGYNGYRPASIQHTYLALESAPTGILAIAGFAAGAAVVVVAQLALKARESQSSKSATSYLLV